MKTISSAQGEIWIPSLYDFVEGILHCLSPSESKAIELQFCRPGMVLAPS